MGNRPIAAFLVVTSALLSSACSILVEGPPGYVPAGQPMPDGACTTG